jgi:hypothetical protein
LNDHVKGGYQFIMRNYREGDKICLFGFSRGAYTARVLAGMLYKIGVLPADNNEQVDFAFSVYKAQEEEGYLLGKEYKKTFSATNLNIEFLGVWDTVSSVGIIPRSHPYTSVNYAVKTFRHALALDERRARFRPNVWTEPTLDRQQDMDFDDPEVEFPPSEMSEERENWSYKPPERAFCDTEEVWFAGCHADIGGGSHDNKVQDSLSYIPLRWMIRECMRKTDILFDLKQVSTYGFSPEELEEAYESNIFPREGAFKQMPPYKSKSATRETCAPNREREQSLDLTKTSLERLGLTGKNLPNRDAYSDADVNQARALLGSGIDKSDRRHLDILANIWDQLDLVRPWWLLEWIPMLTTYQNPSSSQGDWVRARRRNLGRGRYIPFAGYRVKVHRSVLSKMLATAPKDDAQEGSKEALSDDDPTHYEPCACNWRRLEDSGMILWVD